MVTFADSALIWLIHFLLIITRFSAMFVLSPVLGRSNIPQMAKIGFSLLMACIVINYLPPPEFFPYDNTLALLGAIVIELIIGFVMGFVTILFFTTVYAAGQIIDMQIGFSMSQMYDASTGSQIPIAGALLNVIMVEAFVMTDAFMLLIGLTVRTFEVLPVGGASFSPDIASFVLEFFCRSFVISVNIAMPILASALLAEIGLGIVVRTAPQMNVFVVGIPLKIILGLIMILAMIPVFVNATGSIFEQMYSAIDKVFGGMIPVGS